MEFDFKRKIDFSKESRAELLEAAKTPFEKAFIEESFSTYILTNGCPTYGEFEIVGSGKNKDMDVIHREAGITIEQKTDYSQEKYGNIALQVLKWDKKKKQYELSAFSLIDDSCQWFMILVPSLRMLYIVRTQEAMRAITESCHSLNRDCENDGEKTKCHLIKPEKLLALCDDAASYTLGSETGFWETNVWHKGGSFSYMKPISTPTPSTHKQPVTAPYEQRSRLSKCAELVPGGEALMNMAKATMPSQPQRYRPEYRVSGEDFEPLEDLEVEGIPCGGRAEIVNGYAVVTLHKHRVAYHPRNGKRSTMLWEENPETRLAIIID